MAEDNIKITIDSLSSTYLQNVSFRNHPIIWRYIVQIIQLERVVK
jgi:hypothetical protein